MTDLGMTPRSMKVDFFVWLPIMECLIFLMQATLIGWLWTKRPSTRVCGLSCRRDTFSRGGLGPKSGGGGGLGPKL